MQTTWGANSARELALKTFVATSPESSSSSAPDDVMRHLMTSHVVSGDGISVSTPITAIMVVSAFVFLTVFSVIAYVMRVRYRHQVSSWQHVDEQEGIQLQPFIRNA
ncbi:hypothetical protein PR048_002714 [Dryococelus australis]|uniref:Uncharacterized protein n=1 Tax=Dryococelus australis TaxID=614101 RepID=A0ABQ9INA8_9NEOP|nr:hypothetical protein PR048_002714 [Dryococelus australis]